MSINSILHIGAGALTANQSGLRVTSNNIANISTPGYVRESANFKSRSLAGVRAGVDVTFSRVADQFFTAAHLKSISEAAKFQSISGLIDRVQAAIGDPSSGGTVFAGLDKLFSSFGALTLDPSSLVQRHEALGNLESFLQDIGRLYSEIDNLRQEADAKIISGIGKINTILDQIALLNADIQRNISQPGNAAGAQAEQSRLVNELAQLLDIRVEPRDQGGIEIRTTDGIFLAGDSASRISRRTDLHQSRFPGLEIASSNGRGAIAFDRHILGGELRGYINARDKELVDLGIQLGELAYGISDSLNVAHNRTSALPPLAQLNGRNTGLMGSDSLNFTGITHIGIVDTDGRLVRNIEVNFDTGQMTTNGISLGFSNTVGDMVTAMNVALGTDGTASFSDGRLVLSANNGNGLAIQDDASNPSTRMGRQFSHFFGLNDLVTSFKPTFYDAGISGSDTHGFGLGETLNFILRDDNGNILRSIEFTVSGIDFNDLITAINDPTMIGSYATASLNANGRITLSPLGGSGVSRVDIANDQTLRGNTNMSLSHIFGLGEQVPSERARGLKLRPDIIGDPYLLGTATPKISTIAVGDYALTPGDTDGALLLQKATLSPINFNNAGGIPGSIESVTDYASILASDLGLRASNFDSKVTIATALRDEAASRRSSVEGVNLDEELINMSTYQQGYSAASRLIQTAKELTDILLNIV